jgi:hypothetical protein
MNRSKLPTVVLNKVIELDEQVEDLTRTLANTEQGIADARRRLTGGFRSEAEYDDLRAALKKMVDEQPALERLLHAAKAVLSNCRTWLERLPEGTTLTPVKVKANGYDLADVRGKLEAAKAELAELRATPTPSEDIEQRIREYVYSLARPTISGIGDGERLKVIWPGAGWDTRGPIEHRAEVLPMMALLFPNAMVAALMTEVDAMVNDPLPQAERKTRIAELEAEIERLYYTEEALLCTNGASAERSPSAPPQAVLQVRIAEAAKRVSTRAA